MRAADSGYAAPKSSAILQTWVSSWPGWLCNHAAAANAGVSPRFPLERIREMKYSSEEKTAIVLEFVDMAPSDRRDFAIQYADVMLSDGADYVLEQIALRMPAIPASEVNLLRETLQQSRRIGIVSSFADLEDRLKKVRSTLSRFVWESNLQQKKLILGNNLEILDDVGLTILNRFVIGAQIHNEAKDVFEYARHMILLVKCRQYGIDEAFDEILNKKDDYWNI